MALEMKRINQNEENIKEQFKKKDEERQFEEMIGRAVATVQFHFESWFNEVGQFQKKGGKKK